MSLFKKLLPILGAYAGFGGILGGASGIMGSLAGMSLGSAVGEFIDPTKNDGGGADFEAKMAKYNSGGPSRDGALTNLFASRYGGAFDSKEDRDAYDAVEVQKRAVIDPLFSSAANGGIMSFQRGGLIEGPGTVTSDDIDGTVRQDGVPVQDIAVSNGEVIMSGRDLAALDPEGDMDRAGMRLGGAANGSRGAEAARMFSEVQNIKGA